MEKSIRTSNIVYIQKWPWEFGGDYPWWKYLICSVVKINEANKLAERSSLSEAVCFMSKTMRNVNYSSKEIENVPLLMATHDFDKLCNFEIEKGRYFTEIESKSGAKKAIIGSVLASVLFKEENPLNKQIVIMGSRFSVVGVFKKEGTGIFDQGMDNAVLLPVSATRFMFDFETDMLDPTIIIKAKKGIQLEDLTSEIKTILRSIRRIRPADEDNFAINKASQITQGFNEVFKVIDLAGIIIGGFSILVEGFGIANIMFVSVKERTKLIGIQKALGAKKIFILSQFLNEAVLLSLIGGIVGLLFVRVAIFYGEKLVDMSLSLTLENILTGIIISVVVGILSGFAPARSAAKLNPVEAMNSNF